MKRTLLIFCVCVVSGCGEQSGVELTSSEALSCVNLPAVSEIAVKRELDAIVSAYESEESKASQSNMDGVALIKSLTTEKSRQLCRRYFLGRLLAARIERLSYRRQVWAIRFIGDAVCGLRDMASRHDVGWEDWYDVDLRLLVWQKEQILRAKPRHRLREQDDLDPAAAAELQAWRLVYYGGIDSYERRLNDLEAMFHERKRRMSRAVRLRIEAKIAKVLGRPLRTEAQLRRDFKEKRRVVFDVKEDDLAAP